MFDPTSAYKNMLRDPEAKKQHDEFWDRFEKNKQLTKQCPIDPADAEGCDSCQ